MPRLPALLIFLAGIAAAAPAGAQIPAPVARALATAGIGEDSVGLYVRDAANPKPLASHNADRAFNPASAIKLLTTYAALEILGPAYGWTTTVLAAGPVADEVLSGDLILRGGGDPKLTLEAFWLLLRQARARGIRDIRGDLVLDRGFFALDETDPSRFDGEPTRPYNTPPDALLVSFKAVRLSFVPDAERGRVDVIAQPALSNVRVINEVKLDNAPCGDFRARMQVTPQVEASGVRLVATGLYSRQCGESERSYSVLTHQDFVGTLFRDLWKELGGTLGGTVRTATAPAGARVIAVAPSIAVSEAIRDINKYSNNVMARQLYLTIGAAAGGAPATPDKADRAIRNWLAQKGLRLPELVLENGSGLSRVERISARGLSELLAAAWRSPVMPELIASMPVVGVDGTLRKRAQNSDFAGQAHIKGGTLTGVRAMSGYVLDAAGRRTIVTLLVNHPKVTNANIQPAFDALLAWTHARRE